MNEASGEEKEQNRQKLLIGLLLKHQRAMFAYIFSIIPNKSDADDILQETCLTIHEKFSDFEEDSNFLLWANRIAYWKIRESRLKFARSKVVFDERVVEVLNETATELAAEDDHRHEALALCLQKLKDRDRQMIKIRYEPDGGVEEAAKVSNRSLPATYKALYRVKEALFQCINNQTNQSEGVQYS